MNYQNIKIGDKAPNEVNAIIEIKMNSGPVKYEFDKDLGAMVVDRFMHTSMQYPCNYGFIPGTLSGDGDPLDILVYTIAPVATKSVIRVKPIGVLMTEDEKGSDEKILSVPASDIDPYFANVFNYSDLEKVLLSKIEHFFQRYKDLESGKWVKINGWQDVKYSHKIIAQAVKRYNREDL